ncbi:MAG: hypothetical protein QOE90_1420 [Thermoplasmata archaeon]|jgi:hypothetical protein|nr:hypothetical protein [Thermoplasmata archaeon]
MATIRSRTLFVLATILPFLCVPHAQAVVPGVGIGPGGQSILLCDIAVAPTKCVAAVAASASGCADADFQFSLGVVGKGKFCFAAVGGAAASAIVHIPVAIHTDIVTIRTPTGTTTNECNEKYTNILGSSGCGTQGEATGCGASASATAEGMNFGPLSTDTVTANTEDCPTPPPTPGPGSPPPICPPNFCALHNCLTDPILQARSAEDPSEKTPDVGQTISDAEGMVRVGNGPCSSGQSQARFGDLPPEMQAKLKDALATAFANKLDDETHMWPHDVLRDELRAQLMKSFHDAAFSISPGTLVDHVQSTATP